MAFVAEGPLRRPPIRSYTCGRACTLAADPKHNADCTATEGDAIARRPTAMLRRRSRESAQPIRSCAELIARRGVGVTRAKRCAIRAEGLEELFLARRNAEHEDQAGPSLKACPILP